MFDQLRERVILLLLFVFGFSGCAFSPVVPFSKIKPEENQVGFQWEALGNDRFEARFRTKSRKWSTRPYYSPYKGAYDNVCKLLNEKGFNWFAVEDEYYKESMTSAVSILTVKGFKDMPSQIQKLLPFRKDLSVAKDFYAANIKGFKDLRSDMQEFISPKGTLCAISNVVDVKKLLSSHIVEAGCHYFQLSPLYAERTDWFLFDEKSKNYRSTDNKFYYSYAKTKNALLAGGSAVYIKSIDGKNLANQQWVGRGSHVGCIFDLPVGPHKIIVNYDHDVVLASGLDSSFVYIFDTPVVKRDVLVEINAVSGAMYHISATLEEGVDKKMVARYFLKEIPMEFVK